MGKIIFIAKLHLTADKREIKDFPKLPSATSFIHQNIIAYPRKLPEEKLKTILRQPVKEKE